MNIDTVTLAFGNLRHRGLRSWLTLLGIFIGVTAVVSLISLGSGLKMAVSSQFGVSSTQVISVQAGGISGFGPPGTGVSDPLTTDDTEAIEKLSLVERAVSRNILSGRLEYNDRTIFGFATNVPDGKDREFVYEQVELEALEGRLLKDGDTGKVVLGYNFYTDSVGLGKEVVPGKRITIKDKKFDVIGIADKKGSFIFDNVVYMNNRDTEDLWDYGDEVDVIAVLVKDKDSIDRAKEDIEKLLRKRRDVKEGKEDFEVSTPESSLETVNSILSGVQAFIVIIAFISILVGALGIVNTMTTSVMERKKEIGIMKSIGARNEQIFFQFFVESGLLGLVGGLVGVLFGEMIGFLGVMGINSFIGSDMSPNINFVLILGALFGSFLIGAVAGIVPALRAANQNPVEALRS